MFVRWQKRKRRTQYWHFDQRRYLNGVHHLAAVLVESKRVNGKPVLRHLAYLGGINETQLKTLRHRVWFWESATERLDKLKVKGAERAKIEAALAKVAARPTSAEREQIKRELEQLFSISAPLTFKDLA